MFGVGQTPCCQREIKVKLFSNILCVVTSGETGRLTLERALSLAINNQAQLT
jgi:hypothetical protein